MCIGAVEIRQLFGAGWTSPLLLTPLKIKLARCPFFASQWSSISFYETDPREIKRHEDIMNTLEQV
jgi:hypothetical protein